MSISTKCPKFYLGLLYKNILVSAFFGVFGAPGSGAGTATQLLLEAHDDAPPPLVVTRHIDHNEQDDESDDEDGDDNTKRDTFFTFCCKGVQLTPNHNHIHLFFNIIICVFCTFSLILIMH